MKKQKKNASPKMYTSGNPLKTFFLMKIQVKKTFQQRSD